MEDIEKLRRNIKSRLDTLYANRPPDGRVPQFKVESEIDEAFEELQE